MKLSNQQIIEQAIEKARKNGWKPDRVFMLGSDWHLYEDFSGTPSVEYDDDIWYHELIFNHGFAKAFWGEGIVTMDIDNFITDEGHIICELGTEAQIAMPNWQFCLQELVIVKDKLKYIQKYLKFNCKVIYT